MVYAFDTLGYSKRLRDGGVPQEQAESHAEAARDFIMAELVTKTDLLALKSDVLAVKAELVSLRTELKADIWNVRTELKSDIQTLRDELKSEIQTTVQSAVALLEAKIDTQTLRMTVRLGVMQVGAIALLAAILKLT